MNLIIKLLLVITIISVNAQEINYTCTFTNAIGGKWNNGSWNSTAFAPKTKMFVIKTDSMKLDVRSIGELLGGWGGIDASCVFTGGNDASFAHYRCTMNHSSKTFIFNPISKNGALISADGALIPDNFVRKDDIGIETFKCI